MIRETTTIGKPISFMDDINGVYVDPNDLTKTRTGRTSFFKDACGYGYSYGFDSEALIYHMYPHMCCTEGSGRGSANNYTLRSADCGCGRAGFEIKL